MFGYVKADLSKLPREQTEQYRSVYCTLCNSLKQHFGLFARYLLNYDITFLALIKLSAEDAAPACSQKYCPYRAKRCTLITNAQDIFFECACILIILCYEKFLDNIRDERFFKKMLYRFMALVFRRKYRKAREAFPDLCDKIRENMIQQERYEAENAGVDKAAHPSADALGYIFRYGTDSEQLYTFGYMLGRWIYFADAAEDLERDKKAGAFNPFARGYSTQRINEILNLSIGEAAAACQALPPGRYAAIIENIIYEGSFAVQQSILKGDTK
ncbi:MAG: hypothetical protein IJJ41_02150 [Clostridia bacterium]|nr:hypothetical protein [Clostridia bacterium]